MPRSVSVAAIWLPRPSARTTLVVSEVPDVPAGHAARHARSASRAVPAPTAA